MTKQSETDRVWIVRLPDGSVYTAPDSAHDSRGFIYSRYSAEMVAGQTGGVVEYSHSVPSRS